MPNTGERREITKRVNAKEAEMIQQSKKLVSKTRQGSALTDAKTMARSAERRKGRSALK
jgi:cob(I)alamin adenosyltransferase